MIKTLNLSFTEEEFEAMKNKKDILAKGRKEVVSWEAYVYLKCK